MLKATKSLKTITIFEGPDGSGKTTLAKQYAEQTNALYVHFDALYGVQNIHKYFMEAMLPALMGYQSVVLDRCWHSGPIYDLVFRNLEEEEQRQTSEICTLLDRAAAFCDAVYVRCLPPEDVCISNWKSRLDSELVKSESKMRAIHKLYAAQGRSVCLPIVESNYTIAPEKPFNTHLAELTMFINKKREEVYHTNQPRVHIMVSSSLEKTDVDTMIDVPGVRFHKNSNEFMLATTLGEFGSWENEPVAEELVNYISHDMTDAQLTQYFKVIGGNTPQYVFAIGDDATMTMERFMDNIEYLDDGSLPPVYTTYLLDILADSRFRAQYGMLPFNEEVMKAFHATLKGESDEQEAGGPEVELHETERGAKCFVLKFSSLEELKNMNIHSVLQQLNGGGDDAK